VKAISSTVASCSFIDSSGIQCRTPELPLEGEAVPVTDCTCVDATRRVRVTSHCLDDLRDERNFIPRIWLVSMAGAPLKLVRPRVRVHQEEL
jgi:hypothetical protein